MNHLSLTASYSTHQLGRWDLIADIASNQWCAAQPHLIMPKVQVEAQIISSSVKNKNIAKPQHKLTLNYVITLPQPTTVPKLTRHNLTKHHIEHKYNHISPAITPWFMWLPLVDEMNPKDKQADFLWQSTCLECFIAGDTSDKQATDAQQYIEINVASSGHYAIYHFDDYRTPNMMPPRCLISLPKIQKYLQSDSQNSNQNSLSNPPDLLTVTTVDDEVINNAFTTNKMVFGRTVSIDLSPLMQIWHCLTLIHPTVILQHQHSQQLLYFAPKHTNPADFHQQQLWSNIDFLLGSIEHSSL
ncbi:hypothetical protein [Psychrobacter sp. I-STPA10]|uniref:hypothetical protein n=1 Tax=Psychrobacter sp. I-STPA10 TaxID=2585769 RepID=UPI001E4EDA43|nr:hypothetical protein [Psychrobacter sp. I-STPA10]